MNSKTLLRTILLAAGVLILALSIIGIVYVSRDNRQNVIKIDFTDSNEKLIEFNSLSMAPGEEYDYFLRLTSEVEDDFEIAMKFTESDGLILKDYVYVRIECDGEVFCDKLLADLFKNDIVRFDCQLKKKDACEIKVVYYIPEDVGNEIENSSADFDLLISISNEGEELLDE